MNHLLKIKKLNNRYFGLRHGESISNLQDILISAPRVGTKRYGLTPAGKRAVLDALTKAKVLDKNTIIYSSDFLRTKQSAALASQYLNSALPVLAKELRERFFGQLENGSAENIYPQVWRLDDVSKKQKSSGVESVAEVLTRVTKLVSQLEKKYQSKKILLVSHGDPLQILEAAFLRQPDYENQAVKMMKRGELREFKLKKVI